MDSFRSDSSAFKSNPWRTDILCISNGLSGLYTIPELSVSALISLKLFIYLAQIGGVFECHKSTGTSDVDVGSLSG